MLPALLQSQRVGLSAARHAQSLLAWHFSRTVWSCTNGRAVSRHGGRQREAGWVVSEKVSPQVPGANLHIDFCNWLSCLATHAEVKHDFLVAQDFRHVDGGMF